ncbi:hypothetical protein [Celerinatantimonas yamalensis]|uniref:Uncharacterized protein n=1 Tax=Celerinatantimonas yamalensis TaxID=559956 RepID=A0ABW9G1R7_9GAMM
MRQLVILILTATLLSACSSSVKQSQGPEFSLKPTTQVWHFNQPLSQAAWTQIKQQLTPTLDNLRIYPIMISGSSHYQARVAALQHWLLRQGVQNSHIRISHQQSGGVTLQLVRYQVGGADCQPPRVLYKLGEMQHNDLCAVTMLRWQSMVYPEHMLGAQ